MGTWEKDESKMTIAGITLYEPEWVRLKENIGAVLPQVDQVLCIDNGSWNAGAIRKLLSDQYPQVLLIQNKKNRGVAAALNQMFRYAAKNGYGFVLTLDQDSVCADDFMEKCAPYMQEERVGILCPLLQDRNYAQIEKHSGKTERVPMCITSGALTSVGAWEAAGGFTEELFIDYVDYDFCAKLAEHGFRILRVNDAWMLHEIGSGENHCFLGRRVTSLNHAPSRKYYMARNGIYYLHMHRNVINYRKEVAKYLFLYVKTLLYERQRAKKLAAMARGAWDGMRWVRKSNRRT